ncbi:hypothetical protein D3C86_2044380 [compost metagenome]
MRKDQIFGPLEAFGVEDTDENIFGKHNEQRQPDCEAACPEDTGDHKSQRSGQKQLDITAEHIKEGIFRRTPGHQIRYSAPLGRRENQ